jgi:hypothetical protein
MTYQITSLSYDFHTGMATAILTQPAGGLVPVPSTMQITYSLATQVPPLPPTTPLSAFSDDIKIGALKELQGNIATALRTI